MSYTTAKNLILVIGAAFILYAASGLAATGTASVNVTIQSVSEITVIPNELNWTGVSPGSAGTATTFTIKNTGSADVTNIFAYVNTNETEPASPYGLTAADFSSGGLIVLKNSSDTNYYWAQRKEWNWTSTIANINLGALDANSRAAWGFFKNASNEYIWAVGNGTGPDGSLCNNTGALFAIEDDIDTGVAATRTPTTTTITRDGGDAEYSYFSVNRATSSLNGMCVAVSAKCNYILVYKYDKRSNYATCANARYLRPAALAPGGTDEVTANAWAPLGIPSGQLAVATLTVQAT